MRVTDRLNFVENYLFGCSAQEAYEWHGMTAQVTWACYMRAAVYSSLVSASFRLEGGQ